jgi:hypothetical protein
MWIATIHIKACILILFVFVMGKGKKICGYKIYFKGNRKRICILTKQIITSLASSASSFLTLMDLVKP